MSNKKRIFSGIQPSGNLHIGNYLGAIQQWIPMQDEYDCIFCVVDYHAITVPQDPKELNKKIVEIAKIYLASGIDPKKSVIFQQSAISAHTELGWILNTVSRMSDLFKMTQFKDKTGIGYNLDRLKMYKVARNFSTLSEDMIMNRIADQYIEELIDELNKKDNVGVGLFDYPVLMAADILLYDTDVVPVGEDQLQHVELARDIAKRFNHNFTDTFKIPEAKIKKETARIMGLDDPTKKMSKSAKSELNYVSLIDDPSKAAKKIMRAETDSGSEVKYDKDKKPGISNLMTIYSLLGDTELKEIEKKYAGKGYGEFKKDLAEIVKGFLKDFQDKLDSFTDAEVRRILSEGAEKVRPLAEKKMKEVKERIGITI
jgi:tryptophanyl-tRNA synthetase